MRTPALPHLLLLTLIAACDSATAPAPAPATGALRIATVTAGLDTPSSFGVSLDGVALRLIGPNDSAVVKDLSPGSHTVLLRQLGSNCSVQGDNPRTVDVAEGAPTPVLFPVTCVALNGVVQITTLTTGLDGPNLYPVSIDNIQTFIAASNTITLPGLLGGDHLIELGNVPANCSVADGTSRTANVKVGGTTRDTARVAFNASCTSATGVIEVAFNPTGVDIGDAFSIAVDGGTARALTPGTTTRFSVAVGEHAVKLNVVSGTCSVTGGDTKVLTLAASAVVRDTARTLFQASCTPSDLIAFSRSAWIFLVRPDGSNPILVNEGSEPAWSPDRRQIVFSRANCDYYYCYDFGLTIADFRSGTKVVTVLTSQSDYGPAWSPDGSLIAFIRGGNPFLIRPDGSGETGVALPNGITAVSRVAWSADGARLAFTCHGAEDFDDVCVVNRDGSAFARLTSDGQHNTQPAWSPDGSVIAFVRTDYRTRTEISPQAYIALMNADGSGVTRLTTGSDPAWSKDGKTIVFHNSTAAGLATIKPDGTGFTQITTVPEDHAPAWRP